MVTQNDIARHAGVSNGIVSAVLNNRQGGSLRVSAATRERVLKAAADLGYRRNHSARAMRTGRSHAVALLLTTHSTRGPLPEELLEGVLGALDEQEMHLQLHQLPDQSLVDQGVLPRVLSDWMVDGLLINYHFEIPVRMQELIHTHQIPSVWLNVRQEWDCVYPDDRQGSRMLTEYLLSLGHRRIAYFAYPALREDDRVHFSVRDRYQGYLDAMTAAGLPGRLLHLPLPRNEGPSQFEASEEALVEACRGWLQGPERPTAMVLYGSEVLIHFVALSLGLQVPRDLSLVTFSGDRWTGRTGHRVTVGLLPHKEIGRRATQMLLTRIEHPERPEPSVAIPIPLLEGSTCAPPPPGG